MLEVCDLFTLTQQRALKFAGRSDLAALAQIAGASYVRARERTERLVHAQALRGASGDAVEEAEERMVQALIEYAAVLRALGHDVSATDIIQQVDGQTRNLQRRNGSGASPYLKSPA